MTKCPLHNEAIFLLPEYRFLISSSASAADLTFETQQNVLSAKKGIRNSFKHSYRLKREKEMFCNCLIRIQVSSSNYRQVRVFSIVIG